MTKKYFAIFGIIVAIAGLAIGIIWGFGSSKGNVSSADKPSVPGQHTNEKIEALKSELDKVTQYEMAYGCVEKDKHGQDVLCGNSKARVEALNKQLNDEWKKSEKRSPAEVETVVSNIRKLTGKLSLEINFNGTSANPYTSNKKRIEFYEDSDNTEYMIDPETNKIVQFGPGVNSKIKFAESSQLTKQDLKKKAETLLNEYISDFDQVKANFSYKELSKSGGTSYAFRWEAKTKPQGEDITPFVQIVLSPAGEVMSFNDVRSLYYQNQ